MGTWMDHDGCIMVVGSSWIPRWIIVDGSGWIDHDRWIMMDGSGWMDPDRWIIIGGS